MRKLKETVTYIIDGKKEVKTINVFNKQNLLDMLFFQLYEDSYSKNLIMRLNPNIEYIKFENFCFDKNIVFETISYDSIVILENCNFLKKLKLSYGFFEIIDPSFKLYNAKIKSNYSEDISVVFSKDKKLDLSINFDITTKNYSMVNARKIGDFHVNSNRVTISNSVLKNFGNLNAIEIYGANSIIIKDSELASRIKLFLKTKSLNLINSSISGFEETPVELLTETILGNNFILSSDLFINIENLHNYSKYLYKNDGNDKVVKVTDKDYLQNCKIFSIMSFVSNLKAIENNARNNIQTLKAEKNDEYLEKIIHYENVIKELENESVISCKKLERKLKNDSIGTYYR